MSVEEIIGTDLLLWTVKPVWTINFPSERQGDYVDTFNLYGVDRGGLEIIRNWLKINSVEQFNQGWSAQPTDFTFTIALKEKTIGFERIRRLAKGQMFDIQCDVLRKADNPHGDPPWDGDAGYIMWLDGYEKYVGCMVNREGQTIEIGNVPIREFEIVFLEHQTLPSISGNYNDEVLKEGDGTYPSLDDLSI